MQQEYEERTNKKIRQNEWNIFKEIWDKKKTSNFGRVESVLI